MLSRPLTIVAVIYALLLMALAGCALPQWRIFQSKVDPKLAEKAKPQVEAERQAAAFIAEVSKPGTPVAPAAMKQKLESIHAVAVPLSASLGEPEKPVAIEDQEVVIAALRKGLIEEQKKAEQWREFARKFANQPIEGTGINLAGPAGVVGLVLVIAACIAFPPIGYVLLRALPLLWGYFRRTTTAIGEFTKENPDAGKELAAKLSKKMDEAHKRLVRKRASASRITNVVPTAAQ